MTYQVLPECTWEITPHENGKCKQKCIHCDGKVIVGNCDNPTRRNCLKAPPKRTALCIHLGAETRREECTTCQGNVLVKLFACPIHGECSIEKPMGVQICSVCKDYQPQT